MLFIGLLPGSHPTILLIETTQDHLPIDGASHSSLGSSVSIKKQENAPTEKQNWVLVETIKIYSISHILFKILNIKNKESILKAEK